MGVLDLGYEVLTGPAISIFGIVFLYLFPAVMARVRGHSSRSAIFILNALLGWTVLGWIVALVWSFTGDIEEDNSANHSEAGEGESVTLPPFTMRQLDELGKRWGEPLDKLVQKAVSQAYQKEFAEK